MIRSATAACAPPRAASSIPASWRSCPRGPRSLVEVADLPNREGVPHRGVWTREAVKDIARRGRMYLGFVVEKRSRDERPGRHEPILTEPEYQRTIAAVAGRRRVGK